MNNKEVIKEYIGNKSYVNVYVLTLKKEVKVTIDFLFKEILVKMYIYSNIHYGLTVDYDTLNLKDGAEGAIQDVCERIIKKYNLL